MGRRRVELSPVRHARCVLVRATGSRGADPGEAGADLVGVFGGLGGLGAGVGRASSGCAPALRTVLPHVLHGAALPELPAGLDRAFEKPRDSQRISLSASTFL